MNQSNKSGMGFKILGFLVLLMGIVHELYTGEVWKMMAGSDPYIQWTFIYMYLSTGLALVLCGFLLLYMASQLKKTQTLSSYLSWSVCIFLNLLGLGGVAIMPINPFAWVMLVLTLSNVVLIIRYRGQLL